MPTSALAVFSLCVLWMAYVYVLYPLFLVVVGTWRRAAPPSPPPDAQWPSVHILIPAFNEERVIARKLDSTLALDYPRDKLRITVASDQSTDQTDAIAQGYAGRGVEFIRHDVRKGKIRGLSELGMASTADILVITDANALFAPDALRQLMRWFQDPRVGIVNGNRRLIRSATMAGEGEGSYWAYETMLKRAESDVISNAFITGAMTAIRRALFFPLPGDLEFDHVLPLHVVNSGYRVVFAADARFEEDTAVSSTAEWKVRVRNAVRGFTMVREMPRYIRMLRHPLFVAHVYSRKVLRWAIGIPALGAFAANLFLLQVPLFQLAFAGQVLFYALALAGWQLERRGHPNALLALPYYFCLVNAASLVGMTRAFRGKRMAVWTTTR
ncbi:MAG: glycosyltransferase [Lentisphaerae bacterium]|nr:glycosyltransferase [Lentisphaerota bacterium]